MDPRDDGHPMSAAVRETVEETLGLLGTCASLTYALSNLAPLYTWRSTLRLSRDVVCDAHQWLLPTSFQPHLPDTFASVRQTVLAAMPFSHRQSCKVLEKKSIRWVPLEAFRGAGRGRLSLRRGFALDASEVVARIDAYMANLAAVSGWLYAPPVQAPG